MIECNIENLKNNINVKIILDNVFRHTYCLRINVYKVQTDLREVILSDTRSFVINCLCLSFTKKAFTINGGLLLVAFTSIEFISDPLPMATDMFLV